MKYFYLIIVVLIPQFSSGQNLTYSGNPWICSGDELLLFVYGDTAYNWVNTDEPDSILSTSNYLSAYPENNTTYLVYSSTDSLYIDVKVGGYMCYCNYYIPNIFTPDGDDFNDVFKPIIACDHWGAHLTIYNRMQKVVYDTHNQEPEWDGTYQKTGDPVESDMFIWQLSFITGEGETIRLTGFVFLMR